MGRLLYINGAPGVGKLTIARVLAENLKARVLDNHAIYNVGFALADFRSPAFYDAVRAVRAASYDQILRAPDTETIILTAADFTDSNWGLENWQAVQQLAADRRWPFYSIALYCEPSEHRGRIVSEDRAGRGKLQDAGTVELLTRRPLAEGLGPKSLHLDITHMTAGDVAAHIAVWVHRLTGE
jgi:predicted kinase